MHEEGIFVSFMLSLFGVIVLRHCRVLSQIVFGVVAENLYLQYHLDSSSFEALVILGFNFGFDILSTLFSCAQSSPLYLQDIAATENK